MLLTDDLVTVFAFFDRDELERLQIICRQFRGLPDAHFKDHPLRQVSCYVSNDFVGFKRPSRPGLALFAPSKATKVNYDEIEKWFRHDLVGNLEFHCTLDDRIIDMLLPFGSNLRKATCHVPTRFTTLDVVVRGFDELLLCDTMVFRPFAVAGEVSGEANYVGDAMFRLPGVQSCRSLSFRRLVSDRFPVKGLVAWLHECGRKNFHAQYNIRDSADFVAELKTTLGEVAEDSSDLDDFVSDVRYTFTRRAASGEHDDESEHEEVVMDEYWDFGNTLVKMPAWPNKTI